MKKVLLTATVQSHIAQFHIPLIKMLKENEYEVHVAAKNNLFEKNGLKLEYADKIYDIPFHRSPFKLINLVAYQKLRNIINENQYEIIHCNTPMGGVITRLAGDKMRRKGSQMIYTAHGFHFYKGASLKNWLIYYPIEKYLAHFTDKLITITIEDYLLAVKKLKTKIFHVQGVGVDEERYYPFLEKEKDAIRKRMNFSNEETLILCVGELNNNKNQSILLEAMKILKPSHSNIKLLLAGNGPLKSFLKKTVKENNLEKNVVFLGYCNNLNEYLNIADISISASRREGLPLNIMEAMLVGNPIIASSNRGHRELIENAVNGYLVDPNSAEEFSRIILYLLDNNKRRNLGAEGRLSVQPYTSKNILKKMKDIYGIK